ncbi:CHRD domain-containing protein [Geoalkalibacter halelectricus]|uniref:CHRD domain-containing protein n=1 Tax=Geoalkalibacter halelectricus TaxID=2847045 RepID=A0ABY5ZR23_9BACT|nr:CHRD domain-containing protein [Geoalkalibacter halelectricus]MDO3378365.1 CHRD domain-containing protein [Geoalkalibacter halelectricus]UWZ80315.1 CHRD domain-containing protein [Geoalkalibacter halelectricus]
MGIKEGVRRLLLFVAAMVLAFGFWQPAAAELEAYDDALTLPIVVEIEEGVPEIFNFPLWYMDAKFLMLQACLDDPDMCLQELDDENGDNGNGENGTEDLFEEEFIYWAAESEFEFPAHPDSDRADGDGRVRFIFALEGFIEELPEEENGGIVDGVFNEVLIRGRGLMPNAEFRITHPFAAESFIVSSDLDGEIFHSDPLEHPVPTEERSLFDIALDGPIQHFLYSDTLLPREVPVGSGIFYIGDPTFVDPADEEIEGHTVFGSPFGINYVRLEGLGAAEGFVLESNIFLVSGQIFFNEGQNLAPIANFDVTATKLGVPVIIDVLENDLMQGDVPINPTSLEKDGAITGLTGGAVTPVRDLDKVLLQFTPTAAGPGGFDYTVESFTGMFDTAGVDVFVENLQFNQAEYRARTGKWTLNGTSNFRNLIVEDETLTGYYTGLFGAQEVPPVTTSMSGDFWAIFDNDGLSSFDFDLEVVVPEGTNVTQAHIHFGDVGVNGPVIFWLCGNPSENINPPAGTPLCAVDENGVISVSQTLANGDPRFVPRSEVGINLFSDGIEAIQDGRTYVNVHTAAFGPGEVRGQIGVNVISLRAGENGPALGVAEVQAGVGPDLTWSFEGKSIGSPGEAPHMIHAESALSFLGAERIIETLELQLR